GNPFGFGGSVTVAITQSPMRIVLESPNFTDFSGVFGDWVTVGIISGRGWLGVRIQPVTDDIADILGLDTAKGALVAGVIKGGPV
ncbi:serine protease, partial [Rhizobium leguminosarum]